MTTISFMIAGNPIPKSRLRTRVIGRHAILYTPTKTRKYEEHVASVAKDYAPEGGLLTGPLLVYLNFYLKKSKSVPKKVIYHIKRPDVDNFCKSILDALEGVIYKNDSQVVELHATKSYGEPRVEVKVVEL